MSDENKLKAIVGKENPFSVPEGYFEAFQQQLLSSLPERAAITEPKPVRVSMWSKARPWVAAAAVFCGVVVATAAFRGFNKAEDALMAESVVETLTEDEMSDYMATSFFDEYTLYSYLTGSDF